MNYTDFSEDERKFYLSESGFDSREKEFFRLRVYEEKTLFETAEIMGYSPRTIDRISRKVKKKIVRKQRNMHNRLQNTNYFCTSRNHSWGGAI